jgi:hypothetical protein
MSDREEKEKLLGAIVGAMCDCVENLGKDKACYDLGLLEDDPNFRPGVFDRALFRHIVQQQLDSLFKNYTSPSNTHQANIRAIGARMLGCSYYPQYGWCDKNADGARA